MNAASASTATTERKAALGGLFADKRLHLRPAWGGGGVLPKLKRITHMRLIFALGLLALGSAPALAGQAEAQSCASGLDANGQLIFTSALPQVAPGADLKGIVTDTTKSLVKSGQIKRGDARSAAEAAGACLKLAMQ